MHKKAGKLHRRPSEMAQAEWLVKAEPAKLPFRIRTQTVLLKQGHKVSYLAGVSYILIHHQEGV